MSTQYSKAEEIANSITHGVGFLFSIGAITSLLVIASYFGTLTHILSYLLYGGSLLALYAASTLYHALPSERAKKIFKICDHAAIYLLIAGTSTPFVMLHLHGELKWITFIVVWSVALIGIFFKIFFTGRFLVFSTFMYLGMGWMMAYVAKYFDENLSTTALTWLMAGGIVYTVGTIFYLMKKIKFTHAVWHLFVLTGSVFHFLAILYSANFNF